MLKRLVRRAFEAAGLFVQRRSQDPAYTLMGLKQIGLRSIVDVGANEGQFAKFISYHIPDATLYCFEPLPQVFSDLESWARTKKNVTVFNMALGEAPGTVEMFAHSDHSPSSSILETTGLSTQLYPFTENQQRVKVEIQRLDDVLSNVVPAIAAPYLIKLDVQGFEAHVIRGGKSAFSRAAACIIEVSLDGLYEGQSSFKEIFNELDALSFRYSGNLNQVYSTDGHVIYLDAVFRRG